MKDRQYALNLLLDFLLQEIGISSQSCLAFQILLRSRRRLIRRPQKTNPQNLRTATRYLK